MKAAPVSSASRVLLRSMPGLDSLARESRDTLFLLAVIGWIVLMQSAHMPWATTLFCLMVLGWRAWLTLRQKPLPSRWICTGLLLLSLAVTVAQFRTILGRDAGSALILLLLTLKTLELRARRDTFVIFFLGFFTLLSHFLFSQSLLTALGILVGVLALLAALVNAHTPAGYPPLRQSLLIALRMAALGAPIMFALFMLFPRFAPLWGFPAHESAKTGLSDKMTVGAMAELALDDSVAFRVRFDGDIPRRQDLYFRGPVLGHLQGQTWTSEETFAMAESPAATGTNAGTTVTYEVLLQPHQRQWLLTLEMATQRPELPAGWRALQMRSMEWMSMRPVVDVLRYRAGSQLQYRYGVGLHPTMRRAYLALPPELNPRTHELARQLLNDPTLAQGSDEQKVQAVLQRLRTGGYTYTLAPELTGEHASDAFWFDAKEGFCEHIANAFVVLMRAMQIPARIVTGYQGGEVNPMDGMLTVRQSDAHAWAEVWLPERGWTRVDPTAAVSAVRIENLARIETRGAVGNAIDAVSPQFAGLMQRSLQGLRNVWDATNTRWNNWVLNYTQDRQLDLLRRLGFTDVGWATLVQLLAATLAGMAALVALWVWLEKHRQDPWLHLLQQARQRLAGMGLRIDENTSLTPRQLLERLQAALAASGQSSDTGAAWRQWLLALEAWRYAPSDGSNQTQALQQLGTSLRSLPRLPFGRHLSDN
ncbi:MAG: transglutaminaseTgpA domain-containing protein [Brachymonas sp.]